MKKTQLLLLHIIFFVALAVFFMYFTFDYMVYFDIGINNGMREMDIYLIRTPVLLISQIAVVMLFDKFISNRLKRWRIWLNYAAMITTVCIVFLAFALYSPGIPREGGFIRFLGYYFFGLEPGRVPGAW
ncbi:hypothetical protein GW866_04040 [bacterium]|nr:hypothetical protein [bacterium]OIO83644.1 MAG: hypothetical protein AUK02_07630 [Anaerolineae bacterium CG2_30_58_95]PIU91344.1 MAG: hypothetical protein COS63_01200 [Anaerolineae bacterium CG06_land_8_20_14_3_00_57_67]PIW20746.1 MAG: hypothetical protein COW33_01130 [Anaerolineae bacterium CG17_big_fil_post_rev_8_21_14_2_50_57_27]PIX47833.1 MAG: hypothetical protein COZ54_00450 [Anaerolineae bacterium CG_4_8_14_3_um_filter_59_70]PIZ25938.1 MAG: hypothetical protein COY47_03225 [Chloroflex